MRQISVVLGTHGAYVLCIITGEICNLFLDNDELMLKFIVSEDREDSGQGIYVEIDAHIIQN